MSDVTTPESAGEGMDGASETIAKTASTAYNAALDVIASVEPRVAQATRQELADQR